MAEYTPNKHIVRERYWLATVNDPNFPGAEGYANDKRAEFDRWLAQHDAELRAEAERLRAGIERIRDALTAHIVGYGPMIDAEAPEADLTRLLAESGGQPGDARERAWLDADPRKAVENLRAVVGAGEQPGEGCVPCETCGRDQRAGWCKHPAPVVPDSADVRERLRQNWQVFKKHVPVGAYLPVGQMDGDCRECGGSWPCDAVLALLPGRTEREVKAEAWDEAADTLSRHWEDFAPAAVADLERRNPYRKEADDG